MKRFSATAVGLLTLVAAYPAAAQQPFSVQGTQSLIGGFKPQPITMSFVNTSKAIAPMNLAGSFAPARTPTPFSLSQFFPKLTAGPWTPMVPSLSLFKAPKFTPINPQAAFHP